MVKERMFTTALKLAAKWHTGQEDRGGKPYIFHPIRVAMAGQTWEERIVGVLHDVIEDTGCTMEDLEREGFNEEILNAVQALTRDERKETYHDFITRIIAAGKLAISVKLNDMADNMDPARLFYLPETEQAALKAKYTDERERLRSAYRQVVVQEQFDYQKEMNDNGK